MKQVLPTEARPKALARLRSAVAARLDLLLDGVAVVFALSGATVAAVLGKLLVGVILAGLAIGFVLRLKSRKAKLASPTNDPTAPVTGWARFTAGAVSVAEVALLVEAANLPVRFNQEGFHMGHWYLVLLALAAAYLLQLPLFSRLFAKQRTPGAA